LSIKPSPSRRHLCEPIRQANALARQELAGRPGSVFIDLFDAMLGPDGRPRTELYLEDGLHLSLAGYQLWRAILARYQQHLA
jgi:lysophospholipase L1-like esterase